MNFNFSDDDIIEDSNDIDNLYLIYVSESGEHNEDIIYDFYFSDRPDDAIGKRWEDTCLYQVSPPEEEFCTKIGVLKTSELVLSLLEEQPDFRYLEGVSGVIALAWEYVEDFSQLPSLEYKLLSLFYGTPLAEVIEKLEDKGLVLEFK